MYTVKTIDEKERARIEAEHEECHRSTNEQTKMYAAEIRKQVRPDGRYTIQDAEILLMDANNGKPIPLFRAILKGKLRCYPPDSAIPFDAEAYGCDDQHHVYWQEVNQWLNDSVYSNLVYRLPDPHALDQAGTVVTDASVKARKNKSLKTLAFDNEIIRLMQFFWDNRTPGTEPTKGDLHTSVYNEMLRGKIKSHSKKLNVSMVRDAAKQWAMPVVLPSYVPPAQTGEKRHPFKGDK